ALKRAPDVTLTNRANALRDYAPGATVHMRMIAEGASPTRLRGRAGLDGPQQPSNWSLEAEDAETELQVPGSLGFTAYVSSSSTSGEVDAFFDDFVARALR